MPRLPNTLSHPVRATLAALKALAAAHLFARYGWATAHGEGPSMLPTFPVSGDQQFVVSRAHRRGRGVAVGDCVVYAIPARAAGEEGVKRVIGMPGDYVLLNSPGALGPAAPDGSAAAKAGPGAGAGAGEGGKRGRECASMMQVPEGHCYIVGDNLPVSRDSRDFGPVPLALIKGKVTHTLSVNGWWPPDWFTEIPSGLHRVDPSSVSPPAH